MPKKADVLEKRNRSSVGFSVLLDAEMLEKTNRLHLFMTDLTMREILLAVAGHALARGEGIVCQAIMDALKEVNQGT